QLPELTGRFPVAELDRKSNNDQEALLETVAVMSNLDLVVTCDTSLAHLAGALALPVWVALPFAPDWRWLRERSDSPWYPTMRLFRQTAPRDWDGVFRQMTAALTEQLARNQGPR